jgi:hypothetical protein
LTKLKTQSNKQKAIFRHQKSFHSSTAPALFKELQLVIEEKNLIDAFVKAQSPLKLKN